MGPRRGVGGRNSASEGGAVPAKWTRRRSWVCSGGSSTLGEGAAMWVLRNASYAPHPTPLPALPLVCRLAGGRGAAASSDKVSQQKWAAQVWGHRLRWLTRCHLAVGGAHLQFLLACQHMAALPRLQRSASCAPTAGGAGGGGPHAEAGAGGVHLQGGGQSVQRAVGEGNWSGAFRGHPSGPRPRLRAAA